MAQDCIFCKIVRGEIPAKVELVTDTVMAFADIQPQAPTHLLLIPKKHITSLAQATAEDALLLGELQLAAAKIAAEHGLQNGFRLVTNCGDDAGQAVAHIHYHLLGGRKLSWPPG